MNSYPRVLIATLVCLAIAATLIAAYSMMGPPRF